MAKQENKGNTVNTSELIAHIEAVVAKSAPDCRKYLLYQVGDNELYYSINYTCPPEKAQQIEKVIIGIAEQFKLVVTTGRMPE